MTDEQAEEYEKFPKTTVSLNDWLAFTGRQLEAFQKLFTHQYVLYGGARGGGKSYFLRKAAVAWAIYQTSHGLPGINIGLFSSTYNTLKDRQISKIATEFPAWLGTLKETKAQGFAFYMRPEWGGNVISLRNLDEVEKYKSAEFGLIAVDELTEHPVDVFNILRGSMRWPGLENPVFIAGTNPDGIGNEWCYNYFIDHKYPKELEAHSDKFIFVQSLPTDNPNLPKSYWEMLNTLPTDLKKAWLLGDWTVFKGRAFKSFNRKAHVIPQQEIPAHWTRLMGIDWGYRAPFCALFGARDPDTGRVIIYKEIYEPELTDRQQARKILDLSDEVEMKAMRYADPSMWKKATQENVTSTAQVYAENGCYIRQGENDRLGGKRKVDRLLGNLPDGRPGLLITENCRALPRQLELLVYDPIHTEDVNTKMEDHAYDALKYLLTSAREYSQPDNGKITITGTSAYAGLERI
ncbi:MAG TPA: phage terminase large subunit [Candidatus Cloacimonadota bacterium]|nr:phage terminase large subunit [Candidatus Cloacimonadota bacterium]